MKLDRVSVQCSIDRAGLPWAFECSGDFAPVLLEDEGLGRIAASALCSYGPGSGDACIGRE
jgi:hypothetical protein